MNAPGTITVSRRRPRDLLLGWSAGTLAGSTAVLAAADVLGLVDSFQTHQLPGFRIAAVCKLILDLALILAFALSSSAFLSLGNRRARRLELGATSAAAGTTIGLIGGVIATAVGIGHQFPRTYVAILTSVFAARFVSVFAALAASSAFSIANRSATSVLVRRDRRLAWASIGLSGSYALTMISQLFLVSYSSDHGASDGFTAGVSVIAAGAAIAAGAGLVGAIALHGSQRRQRQSHADRLPRRDVLLGVATAVFAVAFLLMGLGAILQAAAGQELDPRNIAVLFLTGVSSLGNAVASVCAAVGFSRSRRRVQSKADSLLPAES